MAPTVEGRPALAPEVVAAAVREHYGLAGRLRPLPAEWDQNFRLDAEDAGTFAVKIANAGTPDDELDLQNAALAWIAERWSEAPTPRAIATSEGATILTFDGPNGASNRLRLLTWRPGEPLSALPAPPLATLEALGRLLGELDRSLDGFSHPAMARPIGWDLARAAAISSRTAAIRDPRRRGLVEQLLLQFQARVAPRLPALPQSVIHNDANDENVLVAPSAEGGRHIAGLVDFGDMVRTATVCEPAVAAAYACLKLGDPLEAIARVAGGYHVARPLSEAEVGALFPLVLMRLGVSVATSAVAAVEDPDNPHRRISDRAAWAALERLAGLDWNEVEERLRAAFGLGVRSRPTPAAVGRGGAKLLAERRLRIAPSLSLSYREPLQIAGGRGAYLFDPAGRAYLDCVNNVCHVGHGHPRVVAALSRQAAALNTNTRYLHPLIVEYARRLTATLPERLSVCYFVNSGSEANDLAVRIARTVTGRREVVVMDGAYHGNTQTLVDLSPYKAEGPGGRGLAPWAHKVPAPDPYRGEHRGADEAAGAAYAEQVGDVCERLVGEGRPPALFLVEPILGCGGQVVPPPAYLREAFWHVRAVGGLCLADEVQVGLGRVGTSMWAFEQHGVVPDLVTLGKPIGNGHPLGAVVTTAEVANAFADGMEFFSTFGGNPVSMAVGLSVLDVLEGQRLREKALATGGYLIDGFRALARRHPQIGDVRGSGLFLGVELVENPETLEPATALTAAVVERAKADGVLLSAEGPHHNVLKIKPPMVFGETEADLLLGAVDRALAAARDDAPVLPFSG